MFAGTARVLLCLFGTFCVFGCAGTSKFSTECECFIDPAKPAGGLMDLQTFQRTTGGGAAVVLGYPEGSIGKNMMATSVESYLSLSRESRPKKGEPVKPFRYKLKKWEMRDSSNKILEPLIYFHLLNHLPPYATEEELRKNALRLDEVLDREIFFGNGSQDSYRFYNDIPPSVKSITIEYQIEIIPPGGGSVFHQGKVLLVRSTKDLFKGRR